MPSRNVTFRRLAVAAVAAALLSYAVPTGGVALAASDPYQDCMRRAARERDAIGRANLELECAADRVLDIAVDGFVTAYPYVERGACELVDKPIYGQKSCR